MALETFDDLNNSISAIRDYWSLNSVEQTDQETLFQVAEMAIQQIEALLAQTGAVTTGSAPIVRPQ